MKPEVKMISAIIKDHSIEMIMDKNFNCSPYNLPLNYKVYYSSKQRGTLLQVIKLLRFSDSELVLLERSNVFFIVGNKII